MGCNGHQVLRLRQRWPSRSVSNGYAFGYVERLDSRTGEDEGAGPPADDFLMGPKTSFVFGNSLYHNMGGGKFEEVRPHGRRELLALGIKRRRLNADGWEDVFIASSTNFPFRYGINSVLLNNRGQKFETRICGRRRTAGGGKTHTPWFDLDCSSCRLTPKRSERPMCRPDWRDSRHVGTGKPLGGDLRSR